MSVHKIMSAEHFEIPPGKVTLLPGIMPAVEVPGSRHTRVLMLDEVGQPYTVTLDGTWTMEQLTGRTAGNGKAVLALPPGQYSAALTDIRPAAPRRRHRRRPRTRSTREREHTAQIRAWARQNGHEVADNGRLPGPVKLAYIRAHAG